MNRQAWQKFVKEQNLSQVKLVDYYEAGKQILPPKGKDGKDGLREYLAGEFFRDLISVGVLRPPTGKKAEDVSFVVAAFGTGLGAPSVLNMHVAPSASEKVEAMEVLMYPQRYFNEKMKLGDPQLLPVINTLTAAIEKWSAEDWQKFIKR